MLVRHYNRNGAKLRKRRIHPDAELDAKLAVDDAIRIRDRERAAGTLQGVGIVSSTRVLVTRPKHVRRNSGFYAGAGTRNLGSYIMPDEASAYELLRDMPMRRKAKSATTAKPSKYNAAEQAVVAKAAELSARRKRLGTQADFD